MTPSPPALTFHKVTPAPTPLSTAAGRLVYTTFLSSQGRVLFDALLHPQQRAGDAPVVLLETDATTAPEVTTPQLHFSPLQCVRLTLDGPRLLQSICTLTHLPPLSRSDARSCPPICVSTGSEQRWT